MSKTQRFCAVALPLNLSPHSSHKSPNWRTLKLCSLVFNKHLEFEVNRRFDYFFLFQQLHNKETNKSQRTFCH